MNTYKKPEVSEEHLESMKGYYGTIGEMSIDEFKKEIEFDKIKLGENLYIPSIKAFSTFAELLKKREGDDIDVGREYGFTMYILGSNIFFKTKEGKEINDIKKYLAQNNIKPYEFKELVFNALYINLKTPFMVDKLPNIIGETRELTTGVLESDPSEKTGDKLLEDELREKLREKQNREILSRVLESNYPANRRPFVLIGKIIDEIDQATFILNEEGKKMCKKSGDQELISLVSHDSPVTLNIKTFLQKFDLNKIYNYTDNIKFTLTTYSDTVYISTKYLLQEVNKSNKPS